MPSHTRRCAAIPDVTVDPVFVFTAAPPLPDDYVAGDNNASTRAPIADLPAAATTKLAVVSPPRISGAASHQQG